MQDDITEYIAELDRIYQAGDATEHSYRPALQHLLQSMMPDLIVTNEPRRIECGAPDFIVTEKGIPVGYVETKDIGVNLEGRGNKQNKEQLNRYKQALDNLIVTDYLTFKWYLYGELNKEIIIGKRRDGIIVSEKSNFDEFRNAIQTFSVSRSQPIKDSVQLSQTMAVRAKLLANNIERILVNDEKAGRISTVGRYLQSFRKALLHDMKPKEFADIYAQTIAYGMFAAWLHDKAGETFTRIKAERLIPHFNPFLRKFFRHIADDDLDVGINWVIDALANLFNYADIASIRGGFDQRDHDPIIHFYETFLAKYDPGLRKSRGVWYTPQPIVRFIVQLVDDILKQDFDIAQGLADSSDRVHILDPALGTGTFLAETVRNVYERFRNQQGAWQSYVSKHLIPRLNGFEILMAPYAMAHLKLEMLLRQTGYLPSANERLRIYLTNSLEEAHGETEFLMTEWLSDEANEASRIKQNVPLMVVMGNPPYSGESQNSGEWMDKLTSDYKKEPSGIKLQERNIKWINDDYVKFIRLGQHFIKRNGEGVLAFINNHGFLDNPTFRGMRWHLLQTFDKIFILDLHGNAKKKETTPTGGKDENVFDIQQGVSINIFVKTGDKKTDSLAKVFHVDLYGKRTEKYDFLRKRRLSTVKWTKLKPTAPMYFFVPKDFSQQNEYEKGFSVPELFPVNSVGIVTARDHFTIWDTVKTVKAAIGEFIELDVEAARDRFDLGKDTRDWSIAGAKKDLTSRPDFGKIVEISYRPFDNRYTYYTGNSKGFHCMPRGNVMRHFLREENVGLMVCRQQKTDGFYHCLMHKNIVESSFVSNQTSEIGYSFPLYLYPDTDEIFDNENRKPNLNEAIIDEIAKRTGLRFRKEKEQSAKTFAPIDVLDYIYAVLHSPTYRERYKEFLKVDFPRVPYPQDAKTFWKLVKPGEMLRKLHLMEGVEPQEDTANYPIAGSNEVETLQYRNGKVRINETQFFDNVSPEAWNFYIGGYQPARKWLKDRKGRTLSYDDIQYYPKIIHVLNETIIVMQTLTASVSGAVSALLFHRGAGRAAKL